MQLSVVIVSYNVRPFLEQCLCSLRAATAGLQAEIIVVDNASSDDTVPFLQPRFPEVRFLQSGRNEGFSKGCNRGWKAAAGAHILFLNPDTLVPEGALAVCLQYFDRHPRCGALGVRMIDGSGRYLPESKRGFPGPMTSLYKMTGLAALFPRSPRFARYYLGHLEAGQTAEAEVLSGAYMMVRRAVLEATGGFDEGYFMYGEDIDLSWRIREGGWTNVYLADVCIVHFKGESTMRGSMAYRTHFYGAMSRFVRRHYGGLRGGLLLAAVRLRAAAARLATAPPATQAVGPVLVVGGAAGSLQASFPRLFAQHPVAGQVPADGPDPARAVQEAATRTGAGVVLYCAGPLSYAAIIGCLDRTGLPGLFHSRGSSTIVGSAVSNAKGVVYVDK